MTHTNPHARRRDRRRPRRPRRRRAPARPRARAAGLRGRRRGRREHPRVGARARVLAVGVQHRPGRRSSCSSATAGRRPSRTATRRATRSSSATSSRWPRRPEIAPALHLGARVVGVTRARDRQAQGRRPRRGAVRAGRRGGRRRSAAYLADAVIDASGTWTRPNPLGAGGLPAAGERAARRPHRLRHPGRARRRPRALRGQARRWSSAAATRRSTRSSTWSRCATPSRRRDRVGDPRRRARPQVRRRRRRPAARRAARSAPRSAAWSTTARSSSSAGFQTRAVVERDGDGSCSPTASARSSADEVIAATGFRPDLALLGELRLDLDDRVEAARALAPLIDPNLHSCGSVPPHGVDELSHPDAGVYMVGMKSYGRAPTFLLRTGYEQVRSVVAALAGDWEAARSVELVLPETGVCNRVGRAGERPVARRRAAAAGSQQRAGRRRGGERRAARARIAPGPRGARGPGASSARSRSPRPSPGGSSTTPSRCSWCRCSASSATRRRS